ncbi:hypothetical protein [Sulfolobus acidocaldarius]|uniref:Uncharacterized protein n=4 Tax=Sulfolobus acidocaldarius TaxID=2285 RepID=Q4JBC7_SULAC|nr:hypothetical protein [Sulfolobus acidocaldarius]AAY79902.1 hypothetical protein Saci_0496 [Sulfolobus acidocaldarius DSM 639]AGE70468.1 hypothetical protein SacN8_02440 [Sulfolobus acidocaldarius N8]AGE72741.1 hypothetical protein SacRon12I_02430 [Sulfolobus acidocaldarius Ron12/I]ALU29154.1 hypothetical protein ATY89_03845 [Sulfolobus acidocaldarius]ALU31879.1 hypothetical protein ATZ20_06870 [Sulfolobus acidocaldarius]
MSNEECSEKVDIPNCEEFKEYLKIWRCCFRRDDKAYFRALDAVEKIRNENDEVNSKTAAQELIKFLQSWHVLSASDISESEDKLASEIRYIKFDLLKDLSNKRLCEDENLEKYEDIIKKAYRRLDNIEGVGPTATSKILHILFPNFFVMWDRCIAEHYIRKSYSRVNEGDYFCFLKKMCQLIREIKNAKISRIL